MILVIDNYDSFVYNQVALLRQGGEEVVVVRNNDITPAAVLNNCTGGAITGVVISSGPKTPFDCGASLEIARRVAGVVPLLGICLGHQIIGVLFGAKLVRGSQPVYGKVERVHTKGTGLFTGLPPSFLVTRYHSWAISAQEFPRELHIDALTKDGTVMAFSHGMLSVYGVQFHPEAALTEYGLSLVQAFLSRCAQMAVGKVK